MKRGKGRDMAAEYAAVREILKPYVERAEAAEAKFAEAQRSVTELDSTFARLFPDWQTVRPPEGRPLRVFLLERQAAKLAEAEFRAAMAALDPLRVEDLLDGLPRLSTPEEAVQVMGDSQPLVRMREIGRLERLDCEPCPHIDRAETAEAELASLRAQITHDPATCQVCLGGR